MLAAIAAAARAAGDRVVETTSYQGQSDWLVLFGVGAEVNHRARLAHVASGRRALLWDLGYLDRKKIVGHLRMSIDTDHPQDWFDATPSDPSRLARLTVRLREDANPKGPILLIGLGRKSRSYLRAPAWEREAYDRIKDRFPTRRIVFRPKGSDHVRLPLCLCDATTPIVDLLRGASLVVCRHSNVAVDATIAGVPFEAENGAAMWLQRRAFTVENRVDFLRRLAWWQWRSSEAAQAWAFAKQVVEA